MLPCIVSTAKNNTEKHNKSSLYDLGTVFQYLWSNAIALHEEQTEIEVIILLKTGLFLFHLYFFMECKKATLTFTKTNFFKFERIK